MRVSTEEGISLESRGATDQDDGEGRLHLLSQSPFWTWPFVLFVRGALAPALVTVVRTWFLFRSV